MVWSVLKHYPETRNSDITLTQEVWKNFYPQYLTKQDGRFYIDIQSLFTVPREDHIKRIRAKIQNERREWLPTDIKVFIERVKLSKEWKAFLGYKVFWDENSLLKAVTDFYEAEKRKQLPMF